MSIEHKESSIVLKASNPSQLFMLGRLYQKFPRLGLNKVWNDKQPPDVEGIEMPDTSLYKLLIDCLDKFDNGE